MTSSDVPQNFMTLLSAELFGNTTQLEPGPVPTQSHSNTKRRKKNQQRACSEENNESAEEIHDPSQLDAPLSQSIAQDIDEPLSGLPDCDGKSYSMSDSLEESASLFNRARAKDNQLASTIDSDPFWAPASEISTSISQPESNRQMDNGKSVPASQARTYDKSTDEIESDDSEISWHDALWDAPPRLTLDSLNVIWKYKLKRKQCAATADDGEWQLVDGREFYNRNEANEAAAQQMTLEAGRASEIVCRSQNYNASGLSAWHILTSNLSISIQVFREATQNPATTSLPSFDYVVSKQVVWEIRKSTIKSSPADADEINHGSPCKRKEMVQTESLGSLFDTLRMANHRAQDIVTRILVPKSAFPDFCVSQTSVAVTNFPPPPFEVCVVMDHETRVLIQVRERDLECDVEDWLNDDAGQSPEQWR